MVTDRHSGRLDRRSGPGRSSTAEERSDLAPHSVPPAAIKHGILDNVVYVRAMPTPWTREPADSVEVTADAAVASEHPRQMKYHWSPTPGDPPLHVWNQIPSPDHVDDVVQTTLPSRQRVCAILSPSHHDRDYPFLLNKVIGRNKFREKQI